MNTLLSAVVVIVGVALFLALIKGKSGSREYPYQLSKYLLSKAERSFYGVLVQAVGGAGIVFSKVRVADAVLPKKGLNRSDWQRAFNAVSAKHFDFIICDPGDCSIKLAVELDDSSHGSEKARKCDTLLNGACRSAGLPLLRVKAARSYVVSEIQAQVMEAMSPQPPAESAKTSPLAADQPEISAFSQETMASTASNAPASSFERSPESSLSQDASPESRACPKCGEPMLLRKAKSGANAGQRFWGCSAFPKCRMVARADA